MKLNSLYILLFALLFTSCRHDNAEEMMPDHATGYPADVEKIIVENCATAGCHNTASKDASAGLDMSTYDKLFNGTNSGAALIPYRGDFSMLLYYTNTDSTQGIVMQPTMPINRTPLSSQQYDALKNWINSGAPDVNGNVMFADNPSRHKFYIANQGCDIAMVFDADRQVAMRVVNLGIIQGASPAEAPHAIRITPDGKYWLVVFLNADVVQVFSTETDQLVKTIPIGNGTAGQWNTIAISSDSKKAYAVDYPNGRVAFVDIDAGTSTTTPSFGVTLHGIALNSNDDTLYVTSQDGSAILKIPVDDPGDFASINLFNSTFPATAQLKPHSVTFSEDFTKYFVTCMNSNEVRVVDAATDQVIHSIPVGIFPLEMSLDEDRDLLFVTNEEDNFFAGMRGSVSVIDINTMTETTKLRAGWQPHGISVDRKKNYLYVANRNVSGGPAPHHSSNCGGSNGNLSVFDLNTLQKITNYKPELSVDPYSVVVRP